MSSKRAAGFSLIELTIAIVIIGAGLAGVLTAFSTVVRSSSDPLIHKQMLSVAEEMMEEILLKPYTDPEGDAAPVNAAIGCGLAAARTAFDDVSDYSNYTTNGICDIDGAAVAGLADYSVTVAIDNAAVLDTVGGGDVIRVTVLVTRGAFTLSLVGWRTNYAA